MQKKSYLILLGIRKAEKMRPHLAQSQQKRIKCDSSVDERDLAVKQASASARRYTDQPVGCHGPVRYYSCYYDYYYYYYYYHYYYYY